MASIRKRKTKEGIKYTVLYDDVDGNNVRKQKSADSFSSKKEADLVRLDLEMKIKTQMFVIPTDETVEEFFERWMEYRSRIKNGR